MNEVLEAVPLRRPMVEPMIRSDPNASLTVGAQCSDTIVGKGVGACRIMPQLTHASGRGIEHVETAIGRGDPNPSRWVDEQIAGGVTRQTFRIARLMAKIVKGFSTRIEACHTCIFDHEP